MAKEINTNRARQGQRGYNVLVVLVAALVLVMIVWGGVYYYGEAIAPEDPVGDANLEEPAETAPAETAPAETAPSGG